MTFSCRLDYIQGVFYVSSLPKLDYWLFRLGLLLDCPDQYWWAEHGLFSGESFSRAFYSCQGFRGGIRWDKSREAYKGILFISGDFLACLSDFKQFRLVKVLKRLRFQFTRVDIALDDWGRRINFDQVVSAGRLGLYRFCHSFDLRASKVSRSDQLVPTCYFGSDNSDKRLRFYDGEVVHSKPFDRWELQLRRSYASQVVSQFLVYGSSVLSSYVIGSIDFVDFIPTSGLSRDYVRSNWWQAFLDAVAVEPLRVSCDASDPDLSQVLRWLKRQVAPTLAVLSEGLESESFENYIRWLVADGQARILNSDRHNALITRLQSVDDSYLLNEVNYA